MLNILIIIQVVLSVVIIVMILMQKGKGADMGVSFGAGASDTLFGSSGAMPFFAKLTWFLAFLFMLNSMSISYVIYKSRNASIVPANTTQTAPAKQPIKVPNKNAPIKK